VDPTARQRIEGFFAAFQSRKYGKDHILISPFDRTIDVYHLVSGQVREYDISDQGDKVVVNLFQPPAFFPISIAVNQSVNRYYFETVGEVMIRRAPAEEVVRFLKTNPDIVYDLLKRVFLGTDVMQRRMVHAMSSTARIRVLYELWLDARRLGEKQADGTLLVPIRVYELAARTGLTRETASRELAKLLSLGIKNSLRGVIVRNLNDLEKGLGDEL